MKDITYNSVTINLWDSLYSVHFVYVELFLVNKYHLQTFVQIYLIFKHNISVPKAQSYTLFHLLPVFIVYACVLVAHFSPPFILHFPRK